MQDYLLLMGLKGPQTFSRGERGSDFFLLSQIKPSNISSYFNFKNCWSSNDMRHCHCKNFGFRQAVIIK